MTSQFSVQSQSCISTQDEIQSQNLTPFRNVTPSPDGENNTNCSSPTPFEAEVQVPLTVIENLSFISEYELPKCNCYDWRDLGAQYLTSTASTPFMTSLSSTMLSLHSEKDSVPSSSPLATPSSSPLATSTPSSFPAFASPQASVFPPGFYSNASPFNSLMFSPLSPGGSCSGLLDFALCSFDSEDSLTALNFSTPRGLSTSPDLPSPSLFDLVSEDALAKSPAVEASGGVLTDVEIIQFASAAANLIGKADMFRKARTTRTLCFVFYRVLGSERCIIAPSGGMYYTESLRSVIASEAFQAISLANLKLELINAEDPPEEVLVDNRPSRGRWPIVPQSALVHGFSLQRRGAEKGKWFCAEARIIPELRKLSRNHTIENIRSISFRHPSFKDRQTMVVKSFCSECQLRLGEMRKIYAGVVEDTSCISPVDSRSALSSSCPASSSSSSQAEPDSSAAPASSQISRKREFSPSRLF